MQKGMEMEPYDDNDDFDDIEDFQDVSGSRRRRPTEYHFAINISLY